MSALPDHQITFSTDHHQSQVIPEESTIQQDDMAMLQTKPNHPESGRLLFEPAAHSTPLRPNKPQPITKPNTFATYRAKPERKRSSRSTQIRGLEAMQLAMQLRRLDLQKRARAADAKGGRMIGVEGEEEKVTKKVGASGKGKERSRVGEAKGEVTKKVTIKEPVARDGQKTQPKGRTSGKENNRASTSKPKTQTVEPDVLDAFALFNRLGITDVEMSEQ